jgi:hypothetical protein
MRDVADDAKPFLRGGADDGLVDRNVEAVVRLDVVEASSGERTTVPYMPRGAPLRMWPAT